MTEKSNRNPAEYDELFSVDLNPDDLFEVRSPVATFFRTGIEGGEIFSDRITTDLYPSAGAPEMADFSPLDQFSQKRGRHLGATAIFVHDKNHGSLRCVQLETFANQLTKLLPLCNTLGEATFPKSKIQSAQSSVVGLPLTQVNDFSYLLPYQYVPQHSPPRLTTFFFTGEKF